MMRVSITLTGLPSGGMGPVNLEVPAKHETALRALVRDMTKVPVEALEAEITDFRDAPINRLVRVFAESVDSVRFVGWGVLESDMAVHIDYAGCMVWLNGGRCCAFSDCARWVGLRKVERI